MSESNEAGLSLADSSIFQSNLPIEAKLERARVELLDLSARNRLLNVPRSGKSARAIDIVDEHAGEIFRLLVRENKVFTFLPGRAKSTEGAGQLRPSDVDEIADLALPEDDFVDGRGIATRHSDTKLQTRLTAAGLQKRLLDLFYDARTLEEEQGVNILYLALGTLKWIDPNNANNIRYAPLVLVPVALERGSVGEKFKLRCRQEDFASNLSLEAYLDRVHGIKLPEFEATEEFEPLEYMRAVGEAASGKPNWGVTEDDIILGFFSFAKFLMYRDLDPANWPAEAKIVDQDLVRSLLADGFDVSEDLVPEEGSIDRYISPVDMLHIVDCDSSQSVAVHEARNGRNLVIQGPPGTGKSQTISNIIAAAIADGKSVLFVAEKMAALEVVKRRLDRAGVGDACLELHSNKANKRALLEELRRTWELGSPRIQGSETLIARLTEARNELNAHADRMHQVHVPAGLTPFQVIGHLTRLHQDGVKPNDLVLTDPARWTPDEFQQRHKLVGELVERVLDIGLPATHAWSGVGIQTVIAPERERITSRVSDLLYRLVAINDDQTAFASALECKAAGTLGECQSLADLAERIAGAPDLDADALAHPIWTDRSQELLNLVEGGTLLSRLTAELRPLITSDAWSTSVESALEQFADLPDTVEYADLAAATKLSELLPSLKVEASRLGAALGKVAPTTLKEIERLLNVGDRVAAAPKASPEAFASDLWDTGVEQAGELAEAVGILIASRTVCASHLTDSAWTTDLREARAALASHGGSIFRFLSGSWRSANRLVKSVLSSPDLPLQQMLPVLDALIRGQAAITKIRDGDALGKSAFGGDWFGERSDPVPLLALVEWMRSLKGLSAEPRLIAARTPDRSEIQARAARVRILFSDAQLPMRDIWLASGMAAARLFGNALDADHADLAVAEEKLTALAAADRTCHDTMVNVPLKISERRLLLERVADWQAKNAQLSAAEAIGRSAFGSVWMGPDSNWEMLRKAGIWIVVNDIVRGTASRIADRPGLFQQTKRSTEEALALARDLEALFDDLKLDMAGVFTCDQVLEVDLYNLLRRLQVWVKEREALSKWVAYCNRAEVARSLGLSDVAENLHFGRIAPSDSMPAFEMAYYEALFADQIKLEPALANFDGKIHGRLAHTFAQLDQERIAASSFEVVTSHHRRIPPINGGNVGPLGVLRGEIARRRGHLPIRQLMQRAAPAVQAIKPVFMMSPLSVAQFLPPGALHFDLLVMDEASQIQPVDALGAIARCDQVVVVGDPQQLPPTTFFSKITGGAEDEEDDVEGARVADIESILGLFTARGLPKRMLRWHYRSRHQSLIAVSNKQFYENKLFIIPSPYTAEAGMGLRFHYIPNGIFETGGSRTNPIEAKIVAEAIVAHAREHPELSLGVAAFSSAQRRAIQDQLELMRRILPPEVESFFQAHPAEPFFVKNLENVQGDERDVIFISVGYGPSAPGVKPTMRFGPLGVEGGERRLNVLISRAKRRCEVFSSMTDEDIEPEFAQTRKGVFAFKLFLHYARTGRLAMAEITGRDQDSVFEEQVARALRDRGYQVHQQVGIAGFFIDLAVADLDRPGRYVLGIECDGEAYHSSRSARDRDRLRQAVLEDHEWQIYRIWSTDWFQRPGEQLELAIAAIEKAKADLANDGQAKPSDGRAVPVDIVTIERDDLTQIGLEGISPSEGTSRYIEVTLQRPSHRSEELHQTPTGVLTELAQVVVEVEGPIHIDEVINRIRDAWGLKRAGGRIQDAVEKAIDVAVRLGRLEQNDVFLNLPGRIPVVRDRSDVNSASLRRPETLPPSEIRVAALDVVRSNYGATDDQIVQAVSRAFGFKSTSSQLREVILDEVNSAVRVGELRREAGMLVVQPSQ